MTKEWLKACGIRALKTFLQSFAAYLGTTVMLSELDMRIVIESSLIAALLSICTSLATGLPEVPFPSLMGDDQDE